MTLRPVDMDMAMKDALLDHIRKALRARILEKIELDIEEAVEAAMDTFNAAVTSWKSPDSYGTIVKVILADKRSKEE
jgi:hypothetical protein